MNRIKDDIKQRKFHNLYLLYGSEELLKKNYRENLKHFILENSDEMNFSKFENRGIDYRMMILPDHPTPIKLKTHVSDPVPYIIYDSTNETDKNANLTYTEENGKKTGIYIEEGYTLMNRFLGK